MAGKIIGLLRELVFPLSIILTIIGIGIVFGGATGIWFQEIPKDMFNISEKNDILIWSPYVLILGFIVLGFGIYYLYVFLKNRKFILDELKTNKRSELLKKHVELKTTVKKMPKKYHKMLKEKEDELKIR